jgi:flavin reductase (DIM6/NTAB) family NADH-FMN oxidoreductase RutF
VTVSLGSRRDQPHGDGFRAFLSRWPSGVTVVTATRHGRSVGCTASALLPVSVTPALLLLSLSASSSTLQAIRIAGVFGVNVLSRQQRHLSHRFARLPQHERFTGVDHTLQDGVPILAGAAATAVCAVQDEHPAADHVLLVARPTWCRPGRSQPLVLLRGPPDTFLTLPPSPVGYAER